MNVERRMAKPVANGRDHIGSSKLEVERWTLVICLKCGVPRVVESALADGCFMNKLRSE